MNGPEASERLEVNLVELYVVVTDDNGRPVRGLPAESFRVRAALSGGRRMTARSHTGPAGMTVCSVLASRPTDSSWSRLI